MNTFSVESWCAYAPGLSKHVQWETFFTNLKQNPPSTDSNADIGFIPAIQRRRLSPIARAVFFVAYQCMESEHNCPSIFCSSHGELHRACTILSSIATNQGVSPKDFSHSVHNAISGLYSISRQSRQASITIAAGEEGYLCAFADAIGQLHEGEETILLVFYEDAIPDIYRPLINGADYPCAFAVKISLNVKKPLISLSFNNAKVTHDNVCNEQPIALINLIRFFSLNESTLNQFNWQLQRIT